jgi:Family of unknown function (DUF6508)
VGVVNTALDERLRRLAAWADRFADPDFKLGSWIPARRGDDGVIQVGWYEISDSGQQFVSEMYELGWVHPFDWMRWLGTADGRRLSGGAASIATASVAQLGKLLTAIIRGERFSDGELEGAFASGVLLAITRRAAELIRTS